MEKGKKKRAPNFSEEEKQTLLTLVEKFKDTIECKRTGAFFIQNKKEAWTEVTKLYNSVCTTGIRECEMLKHFYNNIKHRARKVSADDNKQRYMRDFNAECRGPDNIIHSKELPSPTTVATADADIILYDDILKELRQKQVDEKKNIKKTGGGSYNPVLTEADHQVLSILDSQIHPDENPFDEAAVYFGDTVEDVEVPKTESKSQSQFKTKAQYKFKSQPKADLNIKNKSTDLLKKMYLKKKIQLVMLQKKNEILKYRYENKKQELELKILKKTLEKLEKE